MKKTNVKKLVYIMSPSYSGSTLLTTLLAQSFNIATVGELKANRIPNIEHYHCSCGAKLVECSFWKRLHSTLIESYPDFNLADFKTRFRSDSFLIDRILRPNVKSRPLEKLRLLTLSHLPSARENVSYLMGRNTSIIECASDIQNSSIFLDGSKDPQRLLLFEWFSEYPVFCIYLTRDGRGTVNSDIKYNSITALEASLSWRNKITEMDRALHYLPESNILKLKYEDLCQSPQDTLSRIQSFAQLKKRTSEVTMSNLHILGNNKMRLVNSDTIRLDEKWKDELSKEDLKTFARVAGKLNEALGYTC